MGTSEQKPAGSDDNKKKGKDGSWQAALDVISIPLGCLPIGCLPVMVVIPVLVVFFVMA